MAENIIIFYDDLIDSDNWAAARFLQHAAHKSPLTRLVWIVEPRQVSLGLSMTGKQINACKELLKLHFASHGDPFKILLGGLLKQCDIDRMEGLGQQDKDLLKFAIKPAYGPKEDAMLHAYLMALDLLTTLSSWSGGPVDVFLDADALDDLENPVNLNMHYHEELVNRSKSELDSYEAIMAEPYSQRVKSLRDWYYECIEPLEDKTWTDGNIVNNLNFDSLCDSLKSAKTVKFFGGSSCGLLQRLIQRGVINNMQCYLQAGTFDLSKNLFPNQFNIALNINAAKFVFSKFREFSRFVITPTDAAKRVKYSLAGLASGVPSLGRRCPDFNCRVGSMKLATREVTMKDFPDSAYTMPDLTALLCSFQSGFGGSTLAYASLVDKGGQLILKYESSGIPVYEIHEDVLLKEPEVRDILSTLVVDD